MAQLKIHLLPLLKLPSEHLRLMNLTNVVEPSHFYAFIFYIEGAKQRILVDAGGSAETMLKLNLPVEHVAYPDEALKRVGITPDDIDLVICTHLHIDHMEQGLLYKNARFIIQKEELEAALNPLPIDVPPYPPRESFEDLDFEVIDGDTQIVDGINVLLTPGHTRGGQSVSVDTESGRVIISGLCTTRYNFSPPDTGTDSPPVIPPSIYLDIRQAYDSLVKIKNLADIVIPLHDTELVDSIP